MRDILDLLFRIQQRRKIDLLIIGAWALQVHGYSRITHDVDCMSAVTDDAVIGEEMAHAGFECFDDNPNFRRFRHRLQPAMVLDVMRVSAATFAKVRQAAQPFEIEGRTFHFPSLPHLIALKPHAARNENRAGKDLNDIVEVLRVNRGAVSPVELRELCNEYGTPELTARLKEFL